MVSRGDQRMKSSQGKTIKLRVNTLERLEKVRHKGQSYDGVINELLDFQENYEISNNTKGNHNQGQTTDS